MLISDTFAAALPLTRFRGLARVPNIRAVPGVVNSWTSPTQFLIIKVLVIPAALMRPRSQRRV